MSVAPAGPTITPLTEGVAMSRYKTLRFWSIVLIVLGVMSVISVGFGVISWAVGADGVWDTLAVIFIGAPIVLGFATWPIAVGQALRAIADIGDSVTLEVVGAVTS
jgi:hypothetical protein